MTAPCETISDAPLCQQDLWPPWIRFDVLAQLRREDAQMFDMLFMRWPRTGTKEVGVHEILAH